MRLEAGGWRLEVNPKPKPKPKPTPKPKPNPNPNPNPIPIPNPNPNSNSNPNPKRKVRDVFCCGFVLAYLIGMLLIGLTALDKGEPDRCG